MSGHTKNNFSLITPPD